MRIAFLGKGGSGKTTISAAFIMYTAEKTNHVLAMDADLNAHLQHALRITGKPIFLSKEFAGIAEYLEGNRTIFKDLGLNATPAFGSIPPGRDSTFIYPNQTDPFIQKYALSKGAVSLLTVGTYDNTDVGSACYHSKLNALEIVMHHLADSDNDLVVADTTAGIDNVGTSLLMAYDLNIFVVEPTKKSVDVYLEFKKLTKNFDYPINVKALVNKVVDDEDMAFVYSHIPENEIIGKVPFSRSVKETEQGDKDIFTTFSKDQGKLFDTIENELKANPRNHELYFNKLVSLYRNECEKAWNAYYNVPLADAYQKDFQYSSVLTNSL